MSSLYKSLRTKKICWKRAIKYFLLRELARETLALFGSTYVCESAFSKKKYLKNEYRTRLLDSNLVSKLRLMAFKETPDFASLSARIQESLMYDESKTL